MTLPETSATALKKVQGPAVVETPTGLTYELVTDIEVIVPVGSKVWRLEEENGGPIR